MTSSPIGRVPDPGFGGAAHGPQDPTGFDLRTYDHTAYLRAELLRLFPEAFTDGSTIDFERIRESIGERGDSGREKYGMDWPGRRECIKILQQRSAATLRPRFDLGVSAEVSGNVFIEGDNLEVLKLLRHAYSGRVAAIYIDPPYNTGNDFIYPDDFSDSLARYLEYSGQLGADGGRVASRVETAGRFHSRWLSMMYPRLHLARDLLRSDGFIFISIDDNEVANLRKICDEVFGEANFLGGITIQTNPKGRSHDRHLSLTHDYVLVYAKDDACVDNELGIAKSDEEIGTDYPKTDAKGPYRELELRNTHRKFGRHNRPRLYYPLYADELSGRIAIDPGPGLVEILPDWDDGFPGCWTWNRKTATSGVNELLAKRVKGALKVYRKARAHLADGSAVKKKSKTILVEKAFATEKGQAVVDALLAPGAFPSPKPVELVKYLLSMVPDKDGLYLDFFAGSGTTGQAIYELNKADGGRRRFVLVQFPEPLGDSVEAGPAKKLLERSGMAPNIASLTRERLRRATVESGGEGLPSNDGLALGFRYFQLDRSNFSAWKGDAAEAAGLGDQLRLFVEHILPGRSDDDIVYELALKRGFSLTVRIEYADMGGAKVAKIDRGQMLICVSRRLTQEAVRAMVAAKPASVVCLDEAFAHDEQLKINAALAFRQAGDVDFSTV